MSQTGEGSDRRRHGVVGRRPLLRQARLGQAPQDARAAPLARRAGVPRRPGRGALRHVRRVGDLARAPGPAAARVAVHQGQGLPRHDHPEAVRGPRLLARSRTRGGDEALDALEHRGDLGDGAELARAGRAAAALRHRPAEEPLPAAAREGARDPLLRADQPRGRLRRRLDPGLRRRLQGHGQGKEVLGMRVTWDKRYITLGPVATLLGLAFRLYDPGSSSGESDGPRHHLRARPTNTPASTSAGATCRSTRRSRTGPTWGKDVFMPLDWIIGGSEYAGKGWMMLMGCLAAGRAISLPTSSVGGVKALRASSAPMRACAASSRLPIGKLRGRRGRRSAASPRTAT